MWNVCTFHKDRFRAHHSSFVTNYCVEYCEVVWHRAFHNLYLQCLSYTKEKFGIRNGEFFKGFCWIPASCLSFFFICRFAKVHLKLIFFAKWIYIEAWASLWLPKLCCQKSKSTELRDAWLSFGGHLSLFHFVCWWALSRHSLKGH